MQFLLPFIFVFILFIANSSAVFSTNINADPRGRTVNVSNYAAASMITVNQNGYGNFKTIQAAIDSIPSGNNVWIKVKIAQGIYTEQVTIPREKPYVFLEGQGRENTLITFDAHDRTDTSATFTSYADNVVVKGITFKNSYNCAMRFKISSENIYKGAEQVTPALAARIYGDKSAFIGCGFLGFQDTLWDATGRHYFTNCYIEGAIDFIFGFAQSYYENALINATAGSAVSLGYITANGRASFNDPSGFVFEGGTVCGSGQVMLGRAYGAYARVIFHGTNLSQVVSPQGWDAWSHQGQESKFTYAEIKCKGPGSDTSKRVPWEKKPSESSRILEKFSRSSFIDQDGWIAKIPQ